MCVVSFVLKHCAADASETLYVLTICGPEHAALLYTRGDHVWDQQLVSNIHLAVAPGSCGLEHLSMFIMVSWLQCICIFKLSL